MSKHSTSSWLGCAIAVALLFFVGTTIALSLRQPFPPAQWDNDPVSRAPHPSANPIYRYSVVRGGVHSRTDVVREMRKDPVVETHYAGIPADSLRPVVAQKESFRYVSFRKADRVYWTRRPVTISAGETILQAGATEIRARCGNRLALTPQSPTLPPGVTEPSESELAAVEFRQGDFKVFNAAATESAPLNPSDVLLAPESTVAFGKTPAPSARVHAENSSPAGSVFGQGGQSKPGGLGLLPPGPLSWSAINSRAEVIPPEALRPALPEMDPRAASTTEISIPLLLTAFAPRSPQGQPVELPGSSQGSRGQENERRAHNPDNPADIALVQLPPLGPELPLSGELTAPHREPGTPVMPSVPIPEPKSVLLLATAFTVFAGWRLRTQL